MTVMESSLGDSVEGCYLAEADAPLLSGDRRSKSKAPRPPVVTQTDPITKI
jgi:hypothetical protein